MYGFTRCRTYLHHIDLLLAKLRFECFIVNNCFSCIQVSIFAKQSLTRYFEGNFRFLYLVLPKTRS